MNRKKRVSNVGVNISMHYIAEDKQMFGLISCSCHLYGIKKHRPMTSVRDAQELELKFTTPAVCFFACLDLTS